MGSFVLAMSPIVLGLAVGYARGGRTLRLAGRFRALWLLWLAFVVQMLQHWVAGFRQVVEIDIGVPILAVVFGLGLVWLAVNLPPWPRAMRAGGGSILLGASGNALAIFTNGGRMPYSPRAAEIAGAPIAHTVKSAPADAQTRLSFLIDYIPVPVLHKVASVGDVLIGLGVAVLIAAGMSLTDPTPPTRKPTREEVNT
ncbi:DUF5317 family protein [Actinokineospora soli]|uniref:DUF5317 family protein n=1 Tax=Actinokineospora soli TaxID=1048753 RepID=A0ABW2TL89_9PSEU